MKRLLSHLPLACLLLVCSCVSPEQAEAWESDESGESGESGEEMRAFPGPSDPNPYWCHDVCSLNSGCTKACDAYVVGLTTCGDFGVCNDLDGDGWLHPNDKCPDTPGPNTDCDGDTIGDICDPLDATVTVTSTDDSHGEFGPLFQWTCSGVLYRSWHVCHDEYLETEMAYCAGPKAGTSEFSLEYQESDCALVECFKPVGTHPIDAPNCQHSPPLTC